MKFLLLFYFCQFSASCTKYKAQNTSQFNVLASGMKEEEEEEGKEAKV